MTVQVAEVKRPLTSVGRICDRGNRVIFGRGGGVVQNLRTGNITKFRRDGGIYVLDMWVDRMNKHPFGGQG